MSVSYIPETTKNLLWGKAAGRCEYEGCNHPLWKDDLTQCEFNTAYIAHIIADRPGGERGDTILSELLKADITNLMLLCDEHHRLIDRGDVPSHPVERLREMKRRHEERIDLLTDIHADMRSEILIYGSRIGAHTPNLSYKNSRLALIPERYPASPRAIEISMNASFTDRDKEFWDIEVKHLRRQFNAMINERRDRGQIPHLSVFACADQPLLMELGRLLSDIPLEVEVFQLHREPSGWEWQEHPVGFSYTVIPADTAFSTVALNMSLSAEITNDRIMKVLGEACSIWTMTIPKPNNDFLKSRQQLQSFREEFRYLLERIHVLHGDGATIHIFPAVPVAIAVEIGRVWMPKADLPLVVYDQHRGLGGFMPALAIVPEPIGV